MLNYASRFSQSWLKPGGQLLISDYCCGEKPWTPVFESYVKQRGYILYTPSQYGQVLEINSNAVACTGHSQDWERVKVWGYDERLSAPFFLPQFLKEAGFCNVQAEDRTAQFTQVIETELERAAAIKEEFIKVQRYG